MNLGEKNLKMHTFVLNTLHCYCYFLFKMHLTFKLLHTQQTVLGSFLFS